MQRATLLQLGTACVISTMKIMTLLVLMCEVSSTTQPHRSDNATIVATTSRSSSTSSSANNIADSGSLRNGTRYLRGEDKIRGVLPTVFVIGAQKGGSMSLLELMAQHPLLCGGKHKEPHFFNNDENYDRGADWYKNQFADPKCAQNPKTAKYIDGTPMLHIPDVWKRIQKTYEKEKESTANLKFIVLLREPVSRDYIWYQHVIRADLHSGQRFEDVKTLVEMNEESNFQNADGQDTRRGRYVEQLDNFLKYFRRNQIMVISSAAIFKDSVDILERVRKFIGTAPDASFTQQLPHIEHASLTGIAFELCALRHIPQIDCSYRDKMGAYYSPYNEKLYSWMESTKAEADTNEPEFSPLFEDYKTTPCAKDARAEYNAFLGKEKETIKLREIYHTKTWGFHLPEGACRLVV